MLDKLAYVPILYFAWNKMANLLQRFLVSVHHLTVHNVVLLQHTLDYVSLGELLPWYLRILVVPIQV